LKSNENDCVTKRDVTIKLSKYWINVDISTFSKYRVDYEYLQSWPISTAQTSCVNQAKKSIPDRFFYRRKKATWLESWSV